MTLTLIKNTKRNTEIYFTQKGSIKISSFSANLLKLKLCLGKTNGAECRIPLNNKPLPITENVADYNSVWFEYDLLHADCVIDYELK